MVKETNIKCRFCGTRVCSAKGLRSHITQTRACREKLHDVMPASWPRRRRSPMATPSPEPDEPGTPPEMPSEDERMDIDPPADAPSPIAAAEPQTPPPAKPRGVTIEEVEDEDAPGAPRWYEDYPKPAGCALDPELNAIETVFEMVRRQQRDDGKAPWAPFEDEDDWKLARWLSKAGLSGGNINEFLELEKIKGGAQPSYHNTRSFFQKIDALPTGPEWTCEFFEVTGDEKDAHGRFRTEQVEFWKRDPVECIKELMGNAAFRDKMRYAPIRVYRDEAGTRREFNEMWTGDWWWNLQELLPEGVTICPVILASDKTQLSRFSGDKQAWPLFHRCMRLMLDSLVDAGKNGVDMLCADGQMRRVHPILAAYVADYPEQCLVGCCMENRCPVCVVDPKKRGMPVFSALRQPEQTIKLMKKHAKGEKPKEFETQGLRPADPFWKDLPHCNIFQCFTPDLLHQLHKGVFKEHIVSWATESVGGTNPANESEVDFRFRTMPSHPSLRHFKLGISLVSQWTGNEFKHMEKTFLGVMNGAVDAQVICAVRGVLDFIYYAHFETHTDDSLAKLEEAWKLFHANKEVFIANGVREHFNIPKIHSMKHYVDMIRALGTADGYNTELSERLHIDCAKLGYAASSKKQYIQQMTTWLMRREAIDRFASYLQWAMPGYLVELNDTVRQEPSPDSDDGESDDEPEDTDPSTASIPPYTVAKKAPFRRVTVASLEGEYGATNFLSHLENFLRAEDLLPRRFHDISATFSVYKRVVVNIPAVVQVSDAITKDPIRAVRATPVKGLKRATPTHFDTVLARKEQPSTPIKRLSLDGLFAGRVRAIFALPVEYGLFPVPLAYIEWYTPLTQVDANLGMYKLKPAFQRNSRRASIIPVTLISRSCHLIPRFPRKIDRTLTTDNVLDKCKEFYLNCYLRHIDFVLLRGVE
ncbi:hypothetical protein DFH06DRAFT_1072814 [Mycena polygramma]|nr:hypothetical protein DFH06DRAFT_1072814 [Mycena polygramma]